MEMYQTSNFSRRARAKETSKYFKMYGQPLLGLGLAYYCEETKRGKSSAGEKSLKLTSKESFDISLMRDESCVPIQPLCKGWDGTLIERLYLYISCCLVECVLSESLPTQRVCNKQCCNHAKDNEVSKVVAPVPSRSWEEKQGNKLYEEVGRAKKKQG